MAAACVLGLPVSAQAATVNVAAGASVQAAINANPAGTTFQLAPGTYAQQTISPLANDIFIGAGDANTSAPTVFDGQNINQPFAACYNGVSGVQLENLVIKNYMPAGDTNLNDYELWTGPDWILTDISVDYGGADGVNLYTGSQMYGGDVKSCGHRGIGVSGNSVIVNGVEIAFNNTEETSQSYDAAGLKGGAVNNVTIEYCSVHDNHSIGLWADEGCTNWFILNNFVQNNDSGGIQYEISSSGSIYENLVSNNGAGQIAIVDSNSTNAYRNTVTAAANQNAIFMQTDGNRSDALTTQNNGFNNNFVTFTGVGGFYGLATYYRASKLGSGNYSNYNQFFLNMGTNADVFLWNDYQNDLPFSTYTSTKGEDTSSTVSQY